MWVRLVLPIATMLTFVVPAGAQAGDGDVLQGDGESEPQIFEGTVAANRQWSMVVSIGNFSICTATLVHPRLITTAAHCLEGGAPSVARFGESFGAAVATVPIDFCVSHPEYPGSTDGGIPSNAIGPSKDKTHWRNGTAGSRWSTISAHGRPATLRAEGVRVAPGFQQ